jgi:hypothetical protein
MAEVLPRLHRAPRRDERLHCESEKNRNPGQGRLVGASRWCPGMSGPSRRAKFAGEPRQAVKDKTKPTRGLEEARYAQASVLTSSSLSLFARPRRMSYPKSKLVPRTTIHALARSQGKTDPS